MTRASSKAETLSPYLRQPYTRELFPYEDGSWFGRIVELPGCMTEGDTDAEVLASLNDAMAAWVENAVDHGDPIPEPLTRDGFSGKFIVRVPKSLHRELVRRAELEGVSLNALVSTSLAEMIGGANVARGVASCLPAAATGKAPRPKRRSRGAAS